MNAKNNPVILHYTEGFLDRPWIKSSNHPYKNVFLKYKAMSYWKNEPLESSKKTWYVKLLGWEFLHMPLFFYNVTSWGLSVVTKLMNK
jgi:lipopolysaccharide biosynthesis glycosyltransferase